jgi:hypothetical protein
MLLFQERLPESELRTEDPLKVIHPRNDEVKEFINLKVLSLL